MTLSQKLILFVLAAAVAPIAVSGLWLLRTSEHELSSRLELEQRALAAAAAEATGTRVTLTLDGLARIAALIDFAAASKPEREGALRLLAGQTEGVLAVTTTQPEAPFLTAFDGRPQLKVSAAQLMQLLPVEGLSALGDRGLMALGPVQRGPVRWLPVAIQVGDRQAGVLVVLALSMREVDVWLNAHAPSQGRIDVVDTEGRLVASSQPDAEFVESWASAAMTDGVISSVDQQLAAVAVPGRLGLRAIVAVPSVVAHAPVQSLRRTGAFGLFSTAALLVLVALIFVGRLTGRLGRVATTARAFAQGELTLRAQVGGDDEITALAATFNAMGEELERSRAKLLTWNEELKQRVELATAELKAAQARLLETQKLAALGQLGAGVAHEINNPLVGILGNAQLLLMDHDTADPDFALLRQIEEGARRCKEITQQLLRFSQRTAELSVAQVDLNAVVRRALAVEQPRLTEAGVTLELTLADSNVVIAGDAEALEQVVSQLCANARTAMRSSPRRLLKVVVFAGDLPGFEVEDSGRGIAPEHLSRVFEPFFTTKEVWSNLGLGLSVSYRTVEQHGGRIEVQSRLGEGSRFRVTLARQLAPQSVGVAGAPGGVLV